MTDEECEVVVFTASQQPIPRLLPPRRGKFPQRSIHPWLRLTGTGGAGGAVVSGGSSGGVVPVGGVGGVGAPSAASDSGSNLVNAEGVQSRVGGSDSVCGAAVEDVVMAWMTMLTH